MQDGPWGPIELWEAFGPTYPCIPRERIGDVLDGGKWCALALWNPRCSVRSWEEKPMDASQQRAAVSVCGDSPG